jgi:hypothetical protein
LTNERQDARLIIYEEGEEVYTLRWISGSCAGGAFCRGGAFTIGCINTVLSPWDPAAGKLRLGDVWQPDSDILLENTQFERRALLSQWHFDDWTREPIRALLV